MSKKDKHQKSQLSKIMKHAVRWAIVAGIVGSLLYVVVTAPRISDTGVESKIGLHYHPKLTIYVNSEKITIPNNVGIGVTHNPIHTHEEGDGTLHLEFEGLVKKDDIRLAKFFQVWGKEWTPTSFMGHPIGDGHTLSMTVNNTVITENGNYLMRDKDDIVLTYQ